MSRIAEVLRQRIKESGLTLRAIDAGCGVAPSSVSRFLNGDGLSLASAEKLIDFMNQHDRKKAKEERKVKV